VHSPLTIASNTGPALGGPVPAVHGLHGAPRLGRRWGPGGGGSRGAGAAILPGSVRVCLYQNMSCPVMM